MGGMLVPHMGYVNPYLGRTRRKAICLPAPTKNPPRGGLQAERETAGHGRGRPTKSPAEAGLGDSHCTGDVSLSAEASDCSEDLKPDAYAERERESASCRGFPRACQYRRSHDVAAVWTVQGERKTARIGDASPDTPSPQSPRAFAPLPRPLEPSAPDARLRRFCIGLLRCVGPLAVPLVIQRPPVPDEPGAQLHAAD